MNGARISSGRRDLNPRSPAPEAGAIPSFATARQGEMFAPLSLGGNRNNLSPVRLGLARAGDSRKVGRCVGVAEDFGVNLLNELAAVGVPCHCAMRLTGTPNEALYQAEPQPAMGGAECRGPFDYFAYLRRDGKKIAHFST
jgi:hypothetical protein